MATSILYFRRPKLQYVITWTGKDIWQFPEKTLTGEQKTTLIFKVSLPHDM